MAIILNTDNTAKYIKGEFNQDGKTTPFLLSLKQMQKAVGGFIEIINLPNDEILIINEEGVLKNLPENNNATEIYHNGLDRLNLPTRDTILGNAIFATTVEVE